LSGRTRPKQPSLTIATRVTATLILLSLASAVMAHIALRVPGRAERDSLRRAAIGTSLAASCAPLTAPEDRPHLRQCLSNLASRHSEILGAQVYGPYGSLLADWRRHGDERSAPSRLVPHIVLLSFPLIDHGQVRGVVQIRFDSSGWLRALFSEPTFLAAAVTFALNGLFFRWHIGRVLNLFDPVSAVPQHMRSTLNSFPEGVAILDTENRIVLANDAFASYFENERRPFVGRRIDDFAWQAERPDQPLPWDVAAEADEELTHRVTLHMANGAYRRFRVRAAVILDDLRLRVGVVVYCEDVTAMEEKREALKFTLSELQKSRDELTQQNQELQILATRDPLTSCLNRRTFFELFDKHWQTARHTKTALSCVMLDIDYFKLINDYHGHRAGDEVLRAVAATLQQTVHSTHLVCRYGGEEFCILMPNVDIQEAESLSEHIRKAISQLDCYNTRITASVGVSAASLAAVDPQALIDQADKCLYIAKRNGRNQVVRWDEVPENIGDLSSGTASLHSPEESLPYPAVASLMSALAFRHPETAAHSARVAELAVITARGLMSAKDAYVLEIGALLHDIGKIGVPDCILLKPGPLTPEEWEVMQIHDRIGVEIIESSFANQQLVDILRHHHAWYGDHWRRSVRPIGNDIPLAARIVSIADAYDAIVSDRVYRPSRTQQEAFDELRRCAGTQFDPELVERFISVVEEHKSLELPVGSKYNALQIGLQIERLSKAVDEQDRLGILALASRLEATAAHCQIDEIRSLAAELKRAATSGDDVTEMIQMTHQLIDLCRSTQRAYVDIDLWDGAESHSAPTSVE
jgi:diguanylate cyclase (GGDEF)-like protein/putative nucleotidyltransferase with HDIG domain